MPKDFDMVIRISSERAEVEVEQHSKKGVITRKNISPQSLSTCILTSRHDDESHPTGLLPEGCIAVVMEKKYVYYLSFRKNQNFPKIGLGEKVWKQLQQPPNSHLLPIFLLRNLAQGISPKTVLTSF